MITVVVSCPNGFYDMQVLKEKVPAGGQVEVTFDQFKQMKQSDPSVQGVEKKLKVNKKVVRKIKEEQANATKDTDA